MLLITKTDFINEENNRYTAIVKEPVGYCYTQSEVIEYLTDKEEKTYKGWDGNKYPLYDITVIKKV